MSSPADSLVAPEPVFDRRFYPRTAPSSLTHVVFGPRISGELIDLGENGLRLAAPFELSSNFVCRATLPLGGLERPIEVCVRVVWTRETKEAGIQFMDLSDEYRVQIRKWATLQKKAPGPVDSREILHDAGRQDDPRPEPDQAPLEPTPVVAELQKRRNRIGIAIVLGAACVTLLTATGFAIWATPLRSWVAKPLATRTTSVVAMANGRNPESAPASRPLVETNAADSRIRGDAATPKDGAIERPEIQTPNRAAANELVRRKGANRTSAVQAQADEGSSAQEKSTAKATPATAATSKNEPDANRETPTPSGDKPVGDAKLGSGEGKIEIKPPTGFAAGDAARPSATPDAAAAASGRNAAFRPRQPAAPPAAISAAVPAEPEIIETREPTTRVVDVMLPNSPRPSVVSVPGERVFQSSGLTLRIQRAIVAPAGRATWSKDRRKKVVLGDLLSRVDPRAPRTVDEAGSRVRVRVMLGRDGKVERLMPVNGPAELVPRVMRALREWRFQPTLLDGKPVATAALVTIEFRGPAAAAATR